ncbi:hypothetical protein HHI36_011127 [Cryptolaemus montrouzieri]|uniref:Synembryn-A n=1 Tax=Cryptolaemus montrouzieri TaxID=559131 RepID=A0ABD2MKR4_9CUCU
MKVAKECCKNGILQSIINRMNMYKEPLFPLEIKFFDVKLIFIITALCPEIRKPLADDEYTVRYLIDILGNIVMKSYGDHHGKTATLNNEVVELASEILKALFNLTLRIQSSESELTKYTDLVSILRKCLLASVDAKDKRVTLHNNVINLLTNIPNPCYKALIPPIDADKTEDQLEYKSHDVAALSQILELLKTKMLNDGSVSDQHEILSPITTVLYKGACADRIIRKYLRSEILPPLKDVHSRPEEGSTLRNCLCRLLTTPMTQLRDIIAELLFVLCKKSVRRMIKYTGYGNAAGLFAQRGLLGGREDDGAADFSSDSEDSETEEYAEHKHMINPVLGCYEPPHADAMAEMSDEQKEFEAMKLVQLMDDLMKSGTIKPCRVGKDGKPEPIEHVLQLQESIKGQTNWRQDNCDSD